MDITLEFPTTDSPKKPWWVIPAVLILLALACTAVVSTVGTNSPPPNCWDYNKISAGRSKIPQGNIVRQLIQQKGYTHFEIVRTSNDFGNGLNLLQVFGGGEEVYYARQTQPGSLMNDALNVYQISTDEFTTLLNGPPGAFWSGLANLSDTLVPIAQGVSIGYARSNIMIWNCHPPGN